MPAAERDAAVEECLETLIKYIARASQETAQAAAPPPATAAMPGAPAATPPPPTAEEALRR